MLRKWHYRPAQNTALAQSNPDSAPDQVIESLRMLYRTKPLPQGLSSRQRQCGFGQ